MKKGTQRSRVKLSELLTKKKECVAIAASKNPYRWCHLQSGFGVRCHIEGRHNFVWKGSKLPYRHPLKLGLVKSFLRIEDAREKARELRAAVAKGLPVDDEAQTTNCGDGITLRECWEHRKRSRSKKTDADRISDATVQDIDGYLKRYAADWLDLPIADITTPMLAKRAELIKHREWIKGGKKIGTEPVARQFLIYFSLIWKQTRKFHGGTDNPISLVLEDFPRLPAANGHRCLVDDEIAAVMNLTPDDCLYKKKSGEMAVDQALWLWCLFAKLQLLTGYRAKDLCELSRDEIKSVAIERITSKSRREHCLPLTDEIIDKINQAKEITEELPTDLIFPSLNGQARRKAHGNPSEELKPVRSTSHPVGAVMKLLTKLDRIDARFSSHDLRKTFATIARSRARASREQVKALIGHSGGKEVLDLYLQETDADREALAEVMRKVSGEFMRIASESTQQ